MLIIIDLLRYYLCKLNYFEMHLYTKLVGHCGITGMQFGFEKGGGCE